MEGARQPISDGNKANILLVTGIADPGPLVDHLGSGSQKLEHIAFPDHHAFSKSDIQRLAARFDKFAPGPKLLVTTEKDAVRLRPLIAGSALEGIPVAVIRMRAVLLNEPKRFGALIKEHAGSNKADS
jgi:tetraacyldisaccharide 4'-kinase